MDELEARRRFAGARIARLATADAQGQPHVVPLVLVLQGDTVYSAVDGKPKRHKALRRLANVRLNPRVALLVDHYDDDWTALWWVRADGAARVLPPDDPEAARAVHLLAAKYPQYVAAPPTGEVLAVAVDRWVSWSATP